MHLAFRILHRNHVRRVGLETLAALEPVQLVAEYKGNVPSSKQREVPGHAEDYAPPTDKVILDLLLAQRPLLIRLNGIVMLQAGHIDEEESA